MKKKVAFHNLGCKVNAYETESMRQILESAGYEICPFGPGADVYIVNTCTVTDIADKKSRQMLHRARKMAPQAVVAAVGCYVQTGTARLAEDLAVDLIIGNSQKEQIGEILEQYWREQERREYVEDIRKIRTYPQAGPKGLKRSKGSKDPGQDGHTRVNVKIQDGCDQFCSYCIIPYARGRVRSRRPEDVLEEVRELAAQGYQEVVLTGIHLSSYGVDLRDEQTDLLSLIRQVHQVDEIARIRLGSLEPGIITERSAEGLAALPKICPHFHLSLQSGCDSVLKRMNRRYTAREYRERCGILRKYFTDPALTTDIIVGFPGETEEEFEESRTFVESIGFYETHIFQYSRRAGTRAAAMCGQVPRSVKHARSSRMLELHERQSGIYEERHKHRQAELLVEEREQMPSGGIRLMGHTREYIKAALIKDNECPIQINDKIEVELLDEIEPHVLLCREWEE